uniref:Proliferating cell nuclear antigen PCNA N-terminal domain-containing protein n=1 Tax=Florenciella sp. virus SA2 TaxID=3240092 RepID=A0AB39JD62_9VIRU
MKIVIDSSKKVLKFVELFKMIKSLNDYCTIYCKEDGLFIQVMDDARVSLLNINIDKGWFKDYDSTIESISFNAKYISIILAMYQPNCVVTFVNNDEFMNIILNYADGSEKTFEIHLVDIETDIMESQEIEHSLDFSINTKKLDNYINDMQLFGDTLELIYINDAIYMRSFGENGKYQLKLGCDLLENFVVEEDLKLYCKVSLKFPNLISKLYSTFKSISIHVSEEAPFVFELLDKDEEDNKLNIVYYVAPKIEDDDEFDFSEFDNNELTNEIIE